MTWTYSELPLSKEMLEELEEEFMPKIDRYGHENDFSDAELMESLREYVPKLKRPSDLPWGVAWSFQTRCNKSIPQIQRTIFKNRKYISTVLKLGRTYRICA